jgi:hypothetical protein
MELTFENIAEFIEQRFQPPKHGGRISDRTMTEKKLVRFSPVTLRRLTALAEHFSRDGAKVAPLQMAAILLEMVVCEAVHEKDPKMDRWIIPVK